MSTKFFYHSQICSAQGDAGMLPKNWSMSYESPGA